MIQPITIGLIGKMRAGKDTVAELLAQEYRGFFQRVAYGDALKEHYHAIFGYSEGKDRKGYQTFGQDCRKIDLNIWMKHAAVTIDRIRIADPAANVVVTDVRQPNEAKQLREMGAFLIRVNARDEVRLERMRANGDNFTLADLDHETESHIDSFEVDYELYNNHGLAELIAQLDPMLIEIAILTRGAKEWN